MPMAPLWRLCKPNLPVCAPHGTPHASLKVYGNQDKNGSRDWKHITVCGSKVSRLLVLAVVCCHGHNNQALRAHTAKLYCTPNSISGAMYLGVCTGCLPQTEHRTRRGLHREAAAPLRQRGRACP